MSQYWSGVVCTCILPCVAAPQVSAPEAKKSASPEAVEIVRFVDRSPIVAIPVPPVNVKPVTTIPAPANEVAPMPPFPRPKVPLTSELARFTAANVHDPAATWGIPVDALLSTPVPPKPAPSVAAYAPSALAPPDRNGWPANPAVAAFIGFAPSPINGP